VSGVKEGVKSYQMTRLDWGNQEVSEFHHQGARLSAIREPLFAAPPWWRSSAMVFLRQFSPDRTIRSGPRDETLESVPACRKPYGLRRASRGAPRAGRAPNFMRLLAHVARARLEVATRLDGLLHSDNCSISCVHCGIGRVWKSGGPARVGFRDLGSIFEPWVRRVLTRVNLDLS
jgi:hypothetical protein